MEEVQIDEMKGKYIMENLMNVASYIFNRYYETYGEKIDEMKLHKMLYFAQRESFIRSKKPLFSETFYGWKYGPILKEIRIAYKENSFSDSVSDDVKKRIKPVMDKVFDEYADKSSWSLSRITHGEVSWRNSRKGIPEDASSDNPIDINDIAVDAERVRRRRLGLSNLGSV